MLVMASLSAPALATVDVGIAMGFVMEVAIESADVVVDVR